MLGWERACDGVGVCKGAAIRLAVCFYLWRIAFELQGLPCCPQRPALCLVRQC